MRDTMVALAVLLALASAGGTLTPAYPFGALALGTTGNVPDDGLAFAGNVKSATQDEANDKALNACKGQAATYPARKRAAARCQVIATLNNQCYAFAEDPKDGTPGYGWAIANDQDSANSQAIANCKQTAGRSRQQYCKVDASGCDKQN